jgi:hypothetical protein
MAPPPTADGDGDAALVELLDDKIATRFPQNSLEKKNRVASCCQRHHYNTFGRREENGFSQRSTPMRATRSCGGRNSFIFNLFRRLSVGYHWAVGYERGSHENDFH